MKREIVTSNDMYEVNRASIITEFDRKVLYRLYQPLVGYGAISLYFTLLAELEADMTTTKTSRPHNVIFDLMSCTSKEFTNFVMLLEGVGLVKTYVKDDEKGANYIYCLYAPKSPKEFFDYDLYVSMLKEKLDPKDFDRTKMYFKDNSKVSKSYVDVTSSFNEIFEINVNDLVLFDDKNNLVDHKSTNPSYEFNYEAFYLKIKEFQIDKRKITNDVKQVIEACSAANKLSAFEMAEIVHMSRNSYGDIDLNKISRQSAMRNKTKASYVEVKQEYQYSGSMSVDQKLDMFNSLSPLDFLSVRKDHQPIFGSEQRKIMEFMTISRLSHPVVNVIVDYCFDKNNGAITTTELEYWGSIMQKNKINDAYDALILIEDTLKGKTRKSRVATKQVQPKEVKVDTTSVDEDDNYEELLKQFKEMRKANGKG